MVGVAEYLGLPVTSGAPIMPATEGRCPFADIVCRKIHKDNKKPVCSTRKPDGRLWITCRERLCSSQGESLTDYQRGVLCGIAAEVFDIEQDLENVVYKKEVSFRLPMRKVTRADYILGVRNKRHGRNGGPSRVIVEMQGGGSTSNTGVMTRHVDGWEQNRDRTNEGLGTMLTNVGSIENDSWKRQQDQMMIKGNIAVQSGAGFVLCMGETLHDYICDRLGGLDEANVRNLDARWDFVLLPMRERHDRNGNIGFEVNDEKAIYTTFHQFTHMVSTQGRAQTSEFRGEFHTLRGERIVIND